MIDTNIFIDVLAERELFYTHSKAVLEICESKKAQGFLSFIFLHFILYHNGKNSLIWQKQDIGVMVRRTQDVA